jgi:xylose dehydrogenase (NAD/NADP)
LVARPLRLGLLSTAKINDVLLAGVPAGVEVAAVASRDGARARAYADERGIERAHGSYEALLADPGVDAVYVSLPNALHHEWTLKALLAGKHVLCEKPYSRREAQVDEAWDAAAAGGLIVAEARMYRHHPQIARAKELVDSGAVGAVRLMRGNHSFHMVDSGDHRHRPELDAGALMELGCYCISTARLFGGEPEHVLGEQVLRPSGVDADFHAMLRFPGDVVARFDVSFAVPSRQRFEVVGDEATLVLDAPWRSDWGFSVTLERGEEVETVPVPQANSFGLELADFAAAVRGERDPLLGREDALGQARALAALIESARSGAAVSLGTRP